MNLAGACTGPPADGVSPPQGASHEDRDIARGHRAEDRHQGLDEHGGHAESASGPTIWSLAIGVQAGKPWVACAQTAGIAETLPRADATGAAQNARSLHPSENAMNPIRVTAIVLIVAGVLGLLYGGFSYTKSTHDVKLGPIELSVQEKQTVNVPVWAGVGAIVLGGVLLVVGGKKG